MNKYIDGRTKIKYAEIREKIDKTLEWKIEIDLVTINLT